VRGECDGSVSVVVGVPSVFQHSAGASHAAERSRLVGLMARYCVCDCEVGEGSQAKM
jgi:hypothetical protein